MGRLFSHLVFATNIQRGTPEPHERIQSPKPTDPFLHLPCLGHTLEREKRTDQPTRAPSSLSITGISCHSSLQASSAGKCKHRDIDSRSKPEGPRQGSRGHTLTRTSPTPRLPPKGGAVRNVSKGSKVRWAPSFVRVGFLASKKLRSTLIDPFLPPLQALPAPSFRIMKKCAKTWVMQPSVRP